MANDDQRAGARRMLNKSFESSDAFLEEHVANISSSGVFVRCEQPLAIGTRVDLCFTVIVDDVETIEGVGEVVRVQDDPPGMGVAFIELTPESRERVRRLLRAHRTPGAS